MAHLPNEALTLTGGCYCKAIRYSISVPALGDRPLIPDAVDTPIAANEKVQTRMPLVDIDHCNNCRETSGALVQAWVVCPVSWAEWDVLLRPEGADDEVYQRATLSTPEALGPVQQGQSSVTTYVARFNRTDRATRAFCSRCGTNLAYLPHTLLNSPTAFVDLTVGSLDRECLELVRPDRHSWWEYGVDWIRDLFRHGDGGFMIRHATGDVSRSLE